MRRFFVRLVVLCWSFLSVFAQSTFFLIDQSATPETPTPVFNLFSSGLGQEFTPALNGLDFVDLMLASMNSVDSGTFQVRIREETITGNVIGLSEPLWLTTTTGFAPAHFSFPDRVPLSPGRTYVLEVPLSVPGGYDSSFWGAVIGPSPYESGRVVTLVPGDRPANYDLWFREGVVIPEPSIGSLGVAALVLLYLTKKPKDQTTHA